MRLVILYAIPVLASVSVAAQSPLHTLGLTPPDSLAPLVWSSLATDPKGDGLRPRLPDARDLAYAIDPNAEVVWFRVNVYEPLPERWFGINIAIENDDKADNGMAWWGTNKVKFDRLVSAYFSRADEDWQGYSGVADSESVGRGNIANLTRDVKIALDRKQRAIYVGIPRSALGAATTLRIIATVGSMIANNDDVPSEGMATIDFSNAPRR